MSKVSTKKPKGRIIRSTREKICHEIVFIIFVLYAITLLYPFFFLLINSFKINVREMITNPLGFPKQFGFAAYGAAWVRMNIAEMFFNTITLSVGQTVVSMAMTCMAAYVLAKYQFTGNKFIYTFVIVCSVVPTFGAEAALFNLMSNVLHLRNTYIGMLCLCGAFGGPFLYLHSFFKGIPWSFAESAMIDGASDYRIFLQIMVPLAKNGILVFTIMKFMGYWNEYWQPFLYYNQRPTLAVGLQVLSGLAGQGGLPYSVFFAGTILCIIPVLIFYAFFSDKLMSNLNAGGIKG